MKKTKRFAAAVAAMAMAVSMMTVSATMTAFADKTQVSAVSADATHTFKAYPIALGTVTDGKLSDATLENASFTLDQIKAAANSTGATIDAVLSDIENWASDSKQAIAFAKKLAANVTDETNNGTDLTASAKELDNGYYLIVEKNTQNGSVLNANILKVVGGTPLEVTAKTAAPTLVKKVGEETAEEDAEFGKKGDYKYNDVADHSITEKVPFKLYGTLPSNLTMYDHYMYKITDTYDDGLTVDKGSIAVYIDGTQVYAAGIDDSVTNAREHGLTVTCDDTNRTIVVNFVDIKAYGAAATSKVTVEYDAALDEDADVAAFYELNGAKLTYSKDHDSNVEWTPYSGSGNTENPSPENPNHPDTPNNSTDEKPNGDEETGNKNDTPEDKVILYTYKLEIQKTNGTAAITGDAATAAQFTVKQGDKYIEVGADGKVTGFKDEQQLISLDADGKLTIIGLDAGEYTVTEVTPPAGYRLPEKASFTVTITGGINTKQDWDTFAPSESYTVTKQAIAVSGDGAANVKNPKAEAAGTYTAELENAAIGSLPTTGGIGTKIFFIGGGTLAAASGILLIAKKRSKEEEQ